MFRSPNEDYKWSFSKQVERKNQIGRRFSEVFNILLNPNYYEGTPYGKYFNDIDEKGKSRIYVKDPLEKEIKEIVDSKSNEIKYLVGFTGIGKTTLLRNFFGIHNRDILINNENIIIYISFYYAALSSDKPYQSVEDEVISYFSRALGKLVNICKGLFEDQDEFWKKFYNYIENNKPTILENEDLIPGSNFFSFKISTEKTTEQIKNQLDKTCKKNRIEYYSCMMKFLLNYVDNFENLIFIYDDIETKDGIFHRPLIEIARHIHSCFSLLENKKSRVKTIVSMRAYTFRSNIDRQLEARRECIKNNTILKSKTVNLHEIFVKRFDEIERKEKIIETIGNIHSYKDARNQLSMVERQIDISFGSLICNLANCNLCNAMLMYNLILVNVEWIVRGEKENRGSFRLSADNYRLTSETIFSALACGNEKTYSDERNNFFPNLLHNNKDEGTELLNLYIIKYLKRKRACDLYGEIYKDGSEILSDISKLFLDNNNSMARVEIWRTRILYNISYLHNTGILLRSIYDIEDIDVDQIERKYNNHYKLYLSPRGLFLYELFSKSALLLELYRDDIYTDLKNNDKLTSDMNTKDIMEYLIDYIDRLFLYERRYISYASADLLYYQELLGKELIVASLLEGVVKNIKSYYSEKGEEYEFLMRKSVVVIEIMNQYIGAIEKEYGIRFEITEYLNRVIKEG